MKKIFTKFLVFLLLIGTIFQIGINAKNYFPIKATSLTKDFKTQEKKINNEKNFLQNNQNSLQEQQTLNFTNFIVFARFSDEDEFVNDNYDEVAVKELIDNTYNNCMYSVKNYFYSVSNANVRMQSLFLYDNGSSLKLSHSRGYYAEKDEELNPDGYEVGEELLRRRELEEDWANKINTAINNGAYPTDFNCSKEYPFSELDKNGDGKIDAITIIYKNTTQDISVSWSSPLWNYHYYSSDVQIIKDDIVLESNNYVQLTFSYSNSEKNFVYTDSLGQKFLSQSTAVHETSHIFGLKDLYRSTTESPVYFMSLMGKPTSPVGQFMSIKEREVMGWTSKKNILILDNEGTFKIGVSSSTPDSESVIGYKLNLPKINKTLYLEYRKFSGNENIFDSKDKVIYSSNGQLMKLITLKSGLVCYLSNNDVNIPNNLGTTGNNWNYVALGGTYSTKSDCALGFEEGQNYSLDVPGTSLYIEVESVDDNSLTFSISGEELQGISHTHQLVKIERNEPTCQSEGNIKYYYCEECGKYFSDINGENEITKSQTILQKLNHTPEKVEGKEPTCTENGLSDGEKCSSCGQILKEQSVILSLGHQESDWIIDVNPTTEKNGFKHKECLRCGEILNEQIIEKLPSQNPDTTDPDDKGDNISEKNESKRNISLIVSLSIGGGVIILAGIVLIIKLKK